MAHFAKLDENNIVIDVNVVNNSDCGNLEFPDSEPVGIDFLTQWSGGYTNWKQTSYNTHNGVYFTPGTNIPDPDQSKGYRKNYAGLGYEYDSTLDAFIPPKTYPSWILNTQTCQWDAPVPYPNDDKRYYWNEDSKSWIEINT